MNLLCKKIKFPYYKNPDPNCDKDEDCGFVAIPTVADETTDANDHKKVLISRADDLSDFTFQDDFMVVGHESYERIADKLFFNIIENCRYHPQLPLDEIERQRVWLKYLADNDRTFPSWREPLIENDLSDYKKIIPKKLPICSRIENENGKTEVGFQIIDYIAYISISKKSI